MMESTASKRIALFDWLKCWSLLSMIVYHAMFDLVYIFGVSAPWFSSQGAFVWQQSICWVFILVSGAVQPLSRKPWRHVLTLTLCAALLSLSTWVAMPQEFVVFGVLHFLALAALLSTLLAKALAQVPALPAAVISFLLFLLTYSVPYQRYDVPGLFWLGFPSQSFFSGDYFPLLPWLFLYWTGLFLWRGLAPKVQMPLQRMPCPMPVGWVSRNSLWIYLLHQPILMGVFMVIFR